MEKFINTPVCPECESYLWLDYPFVDNSRWACYICGWREKKPEEKSTEEES